MISRRELMKGIGSLGVLATLERLVPAYSLGSGADLAQRPLRRAGEAIDLRIAEQRIQLDGRVGNAMTINGSLPGPLIRLQQGEDATLRVTNQLKELGSIHWHGLLVPPEMDGVPGVSFAGIKPGETFVYRFPVVQSGTYWCHSHSGGQELLGVYAPLIINPIEPEPFKYDRDYLVMLSDWSFQSPETLIRNLKRRGGYYNFQRRTAKDFFADVSRNGLSATISERLLWERMRMDPTDFADVTGYTLTYLMNGLSPAANWSALFHPGERLRLRFINAGASTYFDIRIPGLTLTVVQADGQNVQPVTVDEFRIAPAETYDVIVEPTEDRAFTVFAETMDRSGYARGTLAPRPGMSAEIPARRTRALRTMEDMGMDMQGMEMKSAQRDTKAPETDQKMPGMNMPETSAETPSMQGMDKTTSKIPGTEPVKHGPDHHGVGNSIVPMYTRSRLDDPGDGFENSDRRVLVYTDLKGLIPVEDQREPEREIELHLTGNMERFMWSFDGKKYSEAKTPIAFRYGERLRFTFVNDTMMEHPLHLHGMWMQLENGTGQYIPRKHTVSVKPAERVSVAITVDAPGQWAFHCHLLLHMEMGMFRVIEVSEKTPEVVK